MARETGPIEFAFNAELGRKLALRRRKCRMTQQAVGAMIGVHRNTIRRFEEGEVGLSVWQFLRVCDVLQCHHLLLLPARGFVWGPELLPLERERDRRMRKAVQAERDPELTEEELRA